MSSAVGDRTQQSRQSEKVALERLSARLAEQFPHVPAADVAHAVHAVHADFADSKIRDFLPILIERRVRAELSAGFRAPDVA